MNHVPPEFDEATLPAEAQAREMDEAEIARLVAESGLPEHVVRRSISA